jgi:homoserine kinase type II
MNWLGDADATVMAAVLHGAFGIDVAAVDETTLPSEGTGVSAQWRIIAADDKPFDVAFFRSSRDVARATLAADVSEHCRAQGLPVPTTVADLKGHLVFPTDNGGGYSVTEPLPGAKMPVPMNVSSARSAAAMLGRLHRVLAGYPMPQPQPDPGGSAWRSAPLEELIEAAQAERRRVGKDLTVGDRQRLGVLAERRVAAMRTHLASGRRHVAAAPTMHVVHGNFTAENLACDGSTVSGITGFQAPAGYPAQELAVFAFDPRTVASTDDWTDTALTAVEAYRANQPCLPAAEVAACADVALLTLLTRTPWHPEGAVLAWECANVAVNRLAGQLGELRSALAEIAAADGRSK